MITPQAQKMFLSWASKNEKTAQRVLSVAIEDSQSRGEDIDARTAKDIIGVVEEIIKESK